MIKTHYSSFGLQHNSSWTRPTDLKNNFLYNAGSELNEKTKNYQTFYRDYDAALGRFTAIDPYAASFASQTPYNFAFNDPVALNDPMGDYPKRYSVMEQLQDRNRYGRWREEGLCAACDGSGGLTGNLSSGMTYGGTWGYDGSGAPNYAQWALKKAYEELFTGAPSWETLMAYANIALTHSGVSGAYYNGYTHEWAFLGNSQAEQDFLFEESLAQMQQFGLFGQFDGGAQSAADAYTNYAAATGGEVVFYEGEHRIVRNMAGQGVDFAGEVDHDFWGTVISQAQKQAAIWSTANFAATLHKPLYSGIKEWGRLKAASNSLGRKFAVVNAMLTGIDVLHDGQFKNSHKADLIINSVITGGSFVPGANAIIAPIGVIYTVADFGWSIYSGKSITESIFD